MYTLYLYSTGTGGRDERVRVSLSTQLQVLARVSKCASMPLRLQCSGAHRSTSLKSISREVLSEDLRGQRRPSVLGAFETEGERLEASAVNAALHKKCILLR